MSEWPQGYAGQAVAMGLKDGGATDLVVVASRGPAVSSAMFTRSRFAGPSVVLNTSGGRSAYRGIVVISKCANVATGDEGMANAVEVRRLAAERAGCAPEEILVASTGVIGVQYPMPVIRAGLAQLADPLPDADLAAAATAIMTTDTVAKVRTERIGAGPAMVTGIAKGVGMIEPNMATMLAFLFTDAQVSAEDLDAVFRRVVARTFNAVSVDSDTSTSDTAVIIANGVAGPVDLAELEAAVDAVCLGLVRLIASDGEGATKLIEVHVTGARDDDQAKRVAKTIVNSPLVKTAVHGADPNWGRIAMAIGKCEDDLDILQENVTIGFGGTQVYPGAVGPHLLAQLSEYLTHDEVIIDVGLGIADGAFTAYGCDLTDGYIRINADYTT